MPSAAGRQNDFHAKGLQQPAALEAHALGHGHHQLVAAGAQDKGQGDARVAAGGLDDHGVFADLAVALGGVDHGPADAVLDAPQRVEVFQLAHDRGHAAFGDPAQTDQRRYSRCSG